MGNTDWIANSDLLSQLTGLYCDCLVCCDCVFCDCVYCDCVYCDCVYCDCLISTVIT
jgi:hypothetical protein